MNKLYILCGIPFSGKTTLAKAIEKEMGYVRVDLDEVKFEMYSKDALDVDLKQEDWDRVYQEMYKRIESLLRQGKTVIHDTGNFTRHERTLVKQIAEKVGGVEIYTIFVDTPYEIARQRLLTNRRKGKRFDVSDKDFETTVREMETPGPDENTLVYKYNTPINEWIKENL